MEASLELMKSPNPILYTAEKNPLRHVFQSVWQRIVEVISPYLFLSLRNAPKDRDADIGVLRGLPLV